MRSIINWVRSCFCKHDFLISEKYSEHTGDWEKRTGIKVSMICKNCGYHKSFWKF